MQEIILFSKTPTSALWFTQSSVHWVAGLFSMWHSSWGMKLTTYFH